MNLNTSLFARPHSHLIFPKFASKGKLGFGSVGPNGSDRGHLYDFSGFFSNGQPRRTTYQDTVQATKEESFRRSLPEPPNCERGRGSEANKEIQEPLLINSREAISFTHVI